MDWDLVKIAFQDELLKIAVSSNWTAKKILSAKVPTKRMKEFADTMANRGDYHYKQMNKDGPKRPFHKKHWEDSADAEREAHDRLKGMTKKSAERKKPMSEKVIDVGAPVLVGSGVGKTLADLSLSTNMGASPRRKTLGTIIGALSGLGYHVAEKKKKERKKAHRAMSKTADPFKFPAKGMATQRFLSKPGKSVHDLSPKIGRLGTLPK